MNFKIFCLNNILQEKIQFHIDFYAKSWYNISMKTLLYMDYNNTIEDIVLKKRGNKFFQAMNRLASLSEKLDIVMITKAGDNIDDDILELLYFMPLHQRQMVKGIVKNGGQSYTNFWYEQDGFPRFGDKVELGGKTKREGVELSMPIVDPNNECELLICAGDNVQDDLPMIDAHVKAKKYLIMANERKNLPHIENMIKTTKHSYGVASAIMKICNKLEGILQQNDENIEKICQNDENIEKF